MITVLLFTSCPLSEIFLHLGMCAIWTEPVVTALLLSLQYWKNTPCSYTQSSVKSCLKQWTCLWKLFYMWYYLTHKVSYRFFPFFRQGDCCNFLSFHSYCFSCVAFIPSFSHTLIYDIWLLRHPNSKYKFHVLSTNFKACSIKEGYFKVMF